MNKMIVIAILLMTGNLSLTGQARLEIVIENLDNSKGSVKLDFRNSNDEYLKGFSQEISDNTCTIVIDGLDSGKYTFRYFHDENNNDELDTNWLGIPKEGYGFSNNASGTFGPPKFEKTLFKVKHDTTIYCKAYYIKL
ncbi:MAG: DUF2141 domain-containing protein [Bacteroidota bacterium]|nr:DUF2141 domain-containing protein [Bacteroidota bacterium]